jgi:hypothetical protein
MYLCLNFNSGASIRTESLSVGNRLLLSILGRNGATPPDFGAKIAHCKWMSDVYWQLVQRDRRPMDAVKNTPTMATCSDRTLSF